MLILSMPLVDAQMSRAFLYVDMARKIFTKACSSPTDLVQLLKSRGMEIILRTEYFVCQQTCIHF